MLHNKTVAAVVPAYNEEKLIGRVIETMPRFVDVIIITNDNSSDQTVARAHEAAERFQRKIEIIHHTKNQGVGGSILAGFALAAKKNIDVSVVMAGDAQMDPADLENMVTPIIEGRADFVKGNRMVSKLAWKKMPRIRYIGNYFLSLLTTISSGYWRIYDSQAGYVAISKGMIEKLPLDQVSRGYGFENDILIHLNTQSARLTEVPIQPVYDIGEKSGMLLFRVGPEIFNLLSKRFFWRIWVEFMAQKFQPLILLYFISFIAGLASLFFLLSLIWQLFWPNFLIQTLRLFIYYGVIGIIFFVLGLLADRNHQKHLKVN